MIRITNVRKTPHIKLSNIKNTNDPVQIYIYIYIYIRYQLLWSQSTMKQTDKLLT